MPTSPHATRRVARIRPFSPALPLALCLLATGVGALTPSPAAAAPREYLLERFTGATASPGFVGFGSACLTGAATGTRQKGVPGCPGVAADSGPVPPASGAPHGYLRLTDARHDQAGALLYNQPIPSRDGLEVSFQQWQYGSTTSGPADGIAFFLVDGTMNLTLPGAFGGSLGYAQKRLLNGTWLHGAAGGYLGIGLDVLGNYFDDSEYRGNGCPSNQTSPSGPPRSGVWRAAEHEKITVRGPGNGIDGYCFITSTYTARGGAYPSTLPASTLLGKVRSVSAEPAKAEADLGGSFRTVTVRITPAPNPRVTVLMADGAGAPRPVLEFPAPEPVPTTYKFGFSASTGEWTDVHLIRNLSVRANPTLDLTKTVDSPGPHTVGDTVGYTYTVRNSGSVPVTGVAVIDDKTGPVTCAATTLAPASDTSTDDETTCHATYQVTEADRVAGSVVNHATATADGGVTSPAASATVPVTAPTAAVRAEETTAAPAVAGTPRYAG